MTPTVTRWNSLYDAIRRLLKFEAKLEDICVALNTSAFSSIDIQYLKEYIIVMEPIALAIDFLQADGIFYGFLLPTLVTIKLKYKKIELGDNSVIKQSILDDILLSVEKRFINFYTLNNLSYPAIIASVSHPEVKLKWFNVISETTELNKIDVHNILLSAINEISICDCSQEEVTTRKNSFLEYSSGNLKTKYF